MYLWIEINTEKWNQINACSVILGFSEHSNNSLTLPKKNTHKSFIFSQRWLLTADQRPDLQTQSNIQLLVSLLNPANIKRIKATVVLGTLITLWTQILSYCIKIRRKSTYEVAKVKHEGTTKVKCKQVMEYIGLHYHCLHKTNIPSAHTHATYEKDVGGGQQCLLNPAPNLISIYYGPTVKGS